MYRVNKAISSQERPLRGVDYLFGEPLTFDSPEDVEAAGVMWLELSELDGTGALNYVTEFKWRRRGLHAWILAFTGRKSVQI